MSNLPANQIRKQRLERLAWILDNSIRVPFTKRKIGIDSLIGLIPGVGDAIGGLLSTWILAQGVRIGVPLTTLAHMVLNIAVEVLVGFIPFAGDLFDMGWKSNQRNVALLGDYLDRPQIVARASMIKVLVIFAGLTLIGIATIWAGFRMLMWAWQGIGSLFGV